MACAHLLYMKYIFKKCLKLKIWINFLHAVISKITLETMLIIYQSGFQSVFIEPCVW